MPVGYEQHTDEQAAALWVASAAQDVNPEWFAKGAEWIWHDHPEPEWMRVARLHRQSRATASTPARTLRVANAIADGPTPDQYDAFVRGHIFGLDLVYGPDR